MLTADILLARHGSHAELGHVLSGRSEVELSPAGRAEAERLAAWLADVPLAAIHSSPRRRARQTAEVVAGPHGLVVERIDALDEIDFGAWAGARFAKLESDTHWRHWNEARDRARAPGGETMAEATARAVHHLEALTAAGPVLCVTHCDLIRGVVAHYLGLGLDRLLSFDCAPASLTTLAREGQGARIISLNERPR